MTNSSSRSVTGMRGYDALRRLVDLLARQAARERMASPAPATRGRAAVHYTNDVWRGPGPALSTSTCG